MARRAAAFTEADLKRAMKVAQSVAPGAWEFEVDRDGKIVIRPASGEPSAANELDKWLAKHAG